MAQRKVTCDGTWVRDGGWEVTSNKTSKVHESKTQKKWQMKKYAW
jgi:hypothetical protein